ncbi:agamous-like MADS-box protein AGL62 [Phragmites australis]|uniref:agamous-like MADS-box protein AGL62 n=1 Tax=Phragmites australis TaxID=29695 RepID=UPI002D78B7CE|nr:agamous-like MADS-box protein AGL62 [Phragmites australis]
MGRQQNEIMPFKNKEAHQVYFSMRRQGLFKKASELSILCGAIAGRPLSFGHLSIETVIDHFLTSGSPNGPASGGASNDSGGVTNTVHQLNEKYSELQQFLETEKKRK